VAVEWVRCVRLNAVRHGREKSLPFTDARSGSGSGSKSHSFGIDTSNQHSAGYSNSASCDVSTTMTRSIHANSGESLSNLNSDPVLEAVAAYSTGRLKLVSKACRQIMPL